MQVSAISMHVNNNGYYSGIPSYYNRCDAIGDTSFNSLASSFVQNRYTSSDEKLYNDINNWKMFCHSQIVGKKLDVIA